MICLSRTKFNRSLVIGLAVFCICFIGFLGLNFGISKADSKKNTVSQIVGNKRKASKLRLKSIQSIQELIKQTRERDRRYELAKRLGELYVEQFEYLREVELLAYERKYDRWAKRANRKESAEPEPNYKLSNKFLARSVSIYKSVVRKYPSAKDVDVVTYELAKMLMIRDHQEGVKYFKLILVRYPKSRLIPETHLALGEHYFENHEMVEAQKHYKSVMKFPEHSIYTFAVYKLAWTYYNYPTDTDAGILKNKRTTIKLLKKVISLADKDLQNAKFISLREEAIRDLIIVWADTEDIEDAWEYFVKIGSKESFYIMLEKLGKAYAGQGKNKKAIQVYARILREVPKRKNAPAIRKSLMDLQDKVANISGVVFQARVMRKEYLPGGAWYSVYKKDKEVIDGAYKDTELSVRRYATLYHKIGHDKKNARYMAAAVLLYKMYLEAFPKTPEHYELNYYLASLLLEMKKYDQAATEFIRVAKTNTKDGKYLEDSAFSAVVAMEALVKKIKYPKMPPAGQVSKPISMPKSKLKYIAVIDFYAKLFPKKKDTPAMLLTAAKTSFAYGYYQNATKRYKNLVKLNPTSKQATESIKTVLAYYYDRKMWQDSIDSSQEFLVYKKLENKKTSEFVVGILKTSSFQQALAWEKSKEHLKAGFAFRKYALNFPKDVNASRALYNSTLDFRRGTDYPESFKSAGILLEFYPKFSYRAELLILVGEMNEQIAEYESAIKYYSWFARSYPKDKRASAALFNSAVLSRGLGDSDRAIELFSEYSAKNPRATLASEADFQVAELYETQGDFETAKTKYLNFSRRFRKSNFEKSIVAEARAIRCLSKNKQFAQANAEYGKLETRLRKSKNTAAMEARDLVAERRFSEAETSREKFDKVILRDFETLEKMAAQKQALLEKLATAYQRVIAINSPKLTTAALFRLGEAHEVFAQDLLFVFPPKDQPSEVIGEVGESVAKISSTLKRESLKYYEAAYKNSRDFEVYSDWTTGSYRKIASLNPRKYLMFAEHFSQPEYFSYDLRYDPSIDEVIAH